MKRYMGILNPVDSYAEYEGKWYKADEVAELARCVLKWSYYKQRWAGLNDSDMKLVAKLEQIVKEDT